MKTIDEFLVPTVKAAISRDAGRLRAYGYAVSRRNNESHDHNPFLRSRIDTRYARIGIHLSDTVTAIPGSSPSECINTAM
jgi:hypothetical protein